MVPKTSSEPVTDTSIVREGIADIHSAVLSVYHNQRKGRVVISCGNDYMISLEFDGPYGNGGVYGVMVFADKCPAAQAVSNRVGKKLFSWRDDPIHRYKKRSCFFQYFIKVQDAGKNTRSY